VLDLDDTLFLERDYVRSGFRAVESWVHTRFSLSNFAKRAYDHFEQGCRGNIFNLVLEECNCNPSNQDIAAMLSIYRQHEPTISLLPDAIDLLESCKDRCPLALITDGPVDSQTRKVHSLGLAKYFRVRVLTGERLGWAKPSLHAFRHVEQHLGGSGRHFCYIGDNPHKDFQAPIQLGWTTIRIRRNQGIYSTFEPTPSAEPDYEISDLGELKRAISIVLR
jgi:putative hydrolase of the HAD superfamily